MLTQNANKININEGIYVCFFQGKEATVEPWEDTNFHLYKVIDRFGFVQ